MGNASVHAPFLTFYDGYILLHSVKEKDCSKINFATAGIGICPLIVQYYPSYHKKLYYDVFCFF